MIMMVMMMVVVVVMVMAGGTPFQGLVLPCVDLGRGATVHKLHEAELGRGSDKSSDGSDDGRAGALSLWLAYAGSSSAAVAAPAASAPAVAVPEQARLAAHTALLLEQCATFLRCHAESFVTPSPPATATTTGTGTGTGTDSSTTARSAEHSELCSARAALVAQDEGAAVAALGNATLCAAVARTHPMFSCVPVSVPFEAHKVTHTQAHRDQTRLAYRLCQTAAPAPAPASGPAPASAPAPAPASGPAPASASARHAQRLHESFGRVRVQDLRRADELSLGEAPPSLPVPAAVMVAALAQALLSCSSSSSEAETGTGTGTAGPEAGAGAAADAAATITRAVAASLGPAARIISCHASQDGDGTLSVAVLLPLCIGAGGAHAAAQAQAAREVLDYLRYAPAPASANAASASQNTLLTPADYRAQQGVSSASSAVLVLVLPGCAYKHKLAHTYVQHRHRLARCPRRLRIQAHYAVTGYFAVCRSEGVLLPVAQGCVNH